MNSTNAIFKIAAYAVMRRTPCTDGYTLNADGSDCDDIDGVRLTMGDATDCENTLGSYRCVCEDGLGATGVCPQ